MMAVERYEASLAQSHWWWKARGAILRSLLDTYTHPGLHQILDVGCGTGVYLPILAKYGLVMGLDISEVALSLCPPGYKLQRGDCYKLPMSDGEVDMVVSLDMLEHLERDGDALREMVRTLSPGGLVILSVPAMPSLWSSHDERLGHYRRYTRAGLESLLVQSHLTVLECRYTMGVIFPLAWMHRKLSPITSNGVPEGVRLPGWVNRTVEWVCNTETEMRLPMPWGSSLFIVGQKRGV